MVETDEDVGEFNVGPLQCPDCEQVFESKDELVEKELGVAQTLYYCPDCMFLGRFRLGTSPVTSDIA